METAQGHRKLGPWRALWRGGHSVVIEKRETEAGLVGVTWGWSEWAASKLIC